MKKLTLYLNKNHQYILRLLMQKESLSRKELSQFMSITPAAITRLCSELMACGLIKEGECRENRKVGRKQVLLTLQERYGYVMTIDLEVEYTTLALVAISGKVLQQQVIPTQIQQPASAFFSYVCQQLESMREALKVKSHKILGVGVTLPHQFYSKTGTILPHKELWSEHIDINEIFKVLLPYPTFIEDQLLVFSYAHLFYTGDNHGNDLLCVQWDNQILSSITIDQELYLGHYDQAGCLAHYSVDSAGKPCYCGRKGCLEQYVTTTAIIDELKFIYSETETPYLYQYTQGDKNTLNATVLIEYFSAIQHKGYAIDSLVEALLQKVTLLLAQALLNITTFMRPQYLLCFGLLFEQDLLYRMIVEHLLKLDNNYPVQRLQRSWLSYQRSTIAPLMAVIQKTFFSYAEIS